MLKFQVMASAGGPERVLVCDPLPEDALTPLTERGFLVDFRPDISQDDLPGVVGDYHALIVRSSKQVDANVLANPGNLRVVARAGVGVDNIDVDAATAKGIVVINTPDANTISAAEHTVGLIIALARNIPQAYSRMKEGGWDRNIFVGPELRDKTLGIWGFGRIGRAVAARLRAFEMNIIGYDPYIPEDIFIKEGVEYCPEVEMMLERSDFVTVHMRLDDSTRNLVNGEMLARMRPGARLVNAARAELIDNRALIEALDSGQLTGAALDVFEKEPPDRDDPIRLHPKILTTPHLAASTPEALDRVGREAAVGVIAALEGRIPDGAVNLPINLMPDQLRELATFMAVAETVAYIALLLSEGPGVKDVGIEYTGEVSQFDLRPLRASVIRGLVSSVSDQPVNLVNYLQVEQQRGLHIQERNLGTDGVSKIKVKLSYEGGQTSVSGREEHGVKIDGVNDYEIIFDLSKGANRILLCVNDNTPGMVGQVSTFLGKQKVNIKDMSVRASEANDGTAMMAVVVESALTDSQVDLIKSLDGIPSAKFLTLNR